MVHDTGWFKSSYSGTANNGCIEVRITDNTVAIRDSKNPTGPSFTVPITAWTTFLNLVKEN